MSSGIYAIINITNDKAYVGSASNIKSRWHSHRHELNKNIHGNCHLQRAYNKYNDVFIFVVLEFVEDRMKLAEREQYWMDKLQVCNINFGYNILPKARSGIGVKRSSEWILNNSLKHIGKKHLEETKRKIGLSKIGKKRKPFSEEWKANLRKAKAANPYKHSEETKLKMSINIKLALAEKRNGQAHI